MAGHVVRKKDGRWSNALLMWYDCKTPGRNTTTLHWEHDIEVWLKHKLPDDHRTWQQLALNADEWAKLRSQYAEDWPSNTFTDYKPKKQCDKDQPCVFTGEHVAVTKHQTKDAATRKQQINAHVITLPTPGRTIMITIVLKGTKN